MRRLNGKVAFLTGAGAGIAKATALAYAREGAQVAIIELNKETGQAAERDVRAAGGDAVFIETDVTDNDSVKRAVAAIAVFLGSDESRMLTGTTIAADGGRSSYLKVYAAGD